MNGSPSQDNNQPARAGRPWWVGAGALIAVAFVLVLALFAAQRFARPAVPHAAAAPVSVAPAQLATAQDYFAQGDYEYDRGNYDAAIAAYSHAIQLKPDFAQAYNNRAYSYMVKQDYANALPDLDRAIELRPDYVNALMNRGDIYNYYYAIDRPRALADYDRARQLGAPPASVCGHRLLALHNGWSPSIYLDILMQGATAGCEDVSPGY